jgi:hypothetical protein
MHEGWSHPFMIVGGGHDDHDVKVVQVFDITCGYLVI